MDQVVTLNWLNCLCDSSRRAKLRKLTDTSVIDHLLELLVKFQFCTPNCAKFSKEDKKQLIVKFLITKVKDYNSSRLFIDDESVLVACWIFLFHIVWSLEDATLRNHLSFHLDNASQEFIKAFLESIQVQSEINENIVAKCLNRAKEKCAHLDFERSPKEFVSHSSNNSTPNNQTPTGIKRKMSLTLREFLMSPNSQKKFVEEHTKELKRLKIELNNEISEKVEVMEENDQLKQRVDQLSKQLDVKLGENQRLRREIEMMECNLIEANSTVKSSGNEREFSDLRIRLDELRSYASSLELENASISEQLSTKQKDIISITEECETLKKQFDELHLTLISKEEVIHRLSKDKEFFKVEMNNLKEFNQDLSEKIAVLESARVNPAVESNAPNLESELQFQLMKDTIEWAKKNMSVIETEQTRLMNENRSLNERVKNLVDEKKEIDSTLKDLNSRIDTLKTENIALKNSKENLSKKLKHAETKLLNTNRDFESYKTQNESSTKKLIDEKEHLQHEMYALKQSLDQYARITDELSSREEYLVADNKSLVAKLENTKEHLSRNETLLEDFNAQMENLKSENLKLSMKLNDLESQNKTANAKLTEVSKEKTKLLKNREEMEKKLAKNKETIESLVKQTSQEQDRCKELTKMVEVHMKKIEQSENSLKKLEEDRVDLNKRINIQNEELKLTETRYQYEAEAHAIAKNKLAALEKINVDQKSVNKQLETDLKSKQYENKTLVCKIKELEEYLQQTEHVNKKLKISLDELIKEKERITTKYSDLERKSNIDHSVIQSLTDQSTQLQNQNTDLERKIQTLTEQTNSDGEIIQVLQNDNTKLADKLKDISAEFKVVLEESAEKIKREKQLKESISQLREESSTLKTSLEKVNSEKQAVCDKLVDLTHQHENLFNKRINLIESLKSFETLVPSLNEEIVGLRTEVNQLTGTNESLKNQLVELTSQMQLVEAEKLATTTQYDSLVQQLQNLENTYADMIKNKQQLEKFNVERQNMIESLQNDLKSASALNSQLNEKLQRLEKETSHLRGKLDDYEEKSKSLQDTVVQLEAANQRLSADCDVLVKQKNLECDEYELKIAALNEDVLGIRDQLEKMNEINETQLKNLESTQSTLQQTQIEKENLQKENSALIEEKHRIDLDLKNETIQVEKLEDKIAELEKLFGDQTNEMKLLKSDYTRTNEDNQRLNDQLKDFENNICEIQERLKASVQEAETLDSEKKSLLRKIVDFEHSFDELQRQNLTLLKNMQDVTTEKQTIAVEKEDLVKRTKDSDEIIKKLNSEIVDLQNRIDKLSDENKWYEDQLKLTEIALTSVKEQKREFEGKYEKIYEELIDIQSQHQTSKENNSKLQFKIAQLEEANDNQKIQIEKLEQNLSNEAAKLSDVERKLSTTIEQRDTEALEIKNENDRLSEENKTYLDKVKRFEELQSERESLLCTLEQKESKLNEITSRWQVEFDTMRNERSRDAAKIAELLEDCKTQQEMVSALTKELTELQNCYEELNENKTRAMNELRDMFLHQIDQLLSNNETLQNENTKLHESNKEKVWYLNEMRKRISPIIDALEEHEKKLLQLKERNDALTKEIDECNGNKWTLKSQNEQLAVLVAQTDKEKERLNKEIQNLKDEKEILRFKTDELKLDNEEIKNDNNRIRKLMRKESSEHEELRKRTEILNENVEKMRQETEKLSMENSKLKQYLQQLERDHDKQLEIKNTEIDVVKTSIKDLQSELEILRSKHVDLSECNEKLIEERNATLNQKITFEQDNMKLRRRLEEITAQKNEVYTMNEMNSKALENRIQSLISQNDGQLVTIQNLRGENEVLRSEIESTRTNAVASTRKQVEKLEKKIDDLTTTNAQRDELHKKEIESLSEVNHRLQVKMEKQTSLNKSLEIKLANYETLVSEKDALTKRVDELKVKLDESLEQNERITDKMNLIADKNTAFVKENENLLAKMEELETKVDNLNDTVISKDKEIFLLQDEYRIFKDEYRKLSEHKSELDKDWKETLINNFKSATAQCDELNEKNRKLTEEIAENRSTITALEAEIEQIKENSTKLDETRVIASGSDNKTNLILKEENQKLIAEVQNIKKKMLQMKAFLDKEKENYRQKSEKVYSSLTTKIEAEFSDKLERAKSEYNKLIQQKYSMKEIEWKKKEENYQKMLRKEKEHIKELSSQLWNMSDKYLSLRQNVESGGPSNDFRRYSVDNFFSPGTLSRRSQSATHLNMMDAKFPKPLDFDRRLSTMSEDIQFHTKNKKPLALISAKVFPTEDEEMEIFDNACLADLKRGRMTDDSDFNKQRLSVLQARNSLCPPHLKSSYPAETQFLPLQEFKENDIKMGLSGCDINEHSDIENLLPGDRTKKNRNQTSYKKPGPPTPSKHGGRASTIGVETPRNVLKESNDNGTARRKSFTPRLFNIFPIRGHATVTSTTSHHNQDENPSVTPKRNRLQSLRRRFSKNPQELGNTNSGFS